MIGTTLKHYRILSLLGRGGMGEVYVAEDTILRRRVALKVIPENLSDDQEFRRRLEREARALAALKHPNIVTLHSIEETSGRQFLTMELVEGRNLADLIGPSGMPLEQFYCLALPVADALATAHREGIIHRDLKPRNIVVTSDRRPRILDFGLARIQRTKDTPLATEEYSTQTITERHQVSGTLAYMSPEQIEGKNVDSRSDLFSLGVCYYEMLTGHRPFDGDSAPKLIASILKDKPASVLEHSPDLPPLLGEIIDRCLAKDPEQRYQDAARLRADIESCQNADRSQSTARRPSGLFRRRLVPRFATMAIAIFASLGAALWLLLENRPTSVNPKEPSLAIVDFQGHVTAESGFSAASITSLVNVGVLESSPIRVLSHEHLMDLRRRFFREQDGPIHPQEALTIARKAGATLLLSGDVGETDAERYVAWRLVDTQTGRNLEGHRVLGTDVLTLADLVVADVIPALLDVAQDREKIAVRPISELTTPSPEAFREYMAGQAAGEAGNYDEALEHYHRAASIDSTFALAYWRLSEGTPAAWEQERKRAYADHAWQLRSRLGIKDRMKLEAYRESLYFRFSEANRINDQILERWPDDLDALKAVSGYFESIGFATKALAICQRGLEFYPDDPSLAFVDQASLAAIGQLDEALAVVRRIGRKHPDERNWQFLEAGLQMQLGFPDSAEAIFQKQLSANPDDPDARSGLLKCLEARGFLDRAIKGREQLVESGNLTPSEKVDLLLFELRACYIRAGRYEEALGTCARAQVLVPSSGSATAMRAIVVRCWTLSDIGRPREALILCQENASREDFGPLERWEIEAQRTDALTRMDSLQAARESLAILRQAEPFAFATHHVRTYIQLAEIEIRAGRADSARAALREANRFGIISAEFRQYWNFTHARAERAAGNLDRAADEYRRLVMADSSFSLALLGLGQIEELRGHLGEALEAYQALMRLWAQADPGIPEKQEVQHRLESIRRQM